MKDRNSPLNIKKLIEQIGLAILRLPNTEELSDQDWIDLLQAKFKLAAKENLASNEKIRIHHELGLEITQTFDDLETLFDELEGEDADAKQAYLAKFLPTTKDDLFVLKHFCDRFSSNDKFEEGIIKKTKFANNKIGYALATLTYAVNVACKKIQTTEAQESKRDFSFVVSHSGSLRPMFDPSRYEICLQKARNFVLDNHHDIQTEFKQVIISLGQGQTAAILEFINFGKFLESNNIKPSPWNNFGEPRLTQKALYLINEIKNSPDYAYCNDMGTTLYLQKGLEAFTIFQADELPKSPSYTERLRKILHETFNSNNRSESTLAVIFGFPSKGKPVEKAIAILFSPLLLIKNIIKAAAELIPAVIQETAATIFNFSLNKINSCLSYFTSANRKPLGLIAAGFGLLVSGALALTSVIVAIASGVVNVAASLVLSPSHISREAEKTGYSFGKKIGLSDNRAEYMATAFYYTSKAFTVAAYITIGFFTAGIAPAIAKLGAAGEWLAGAAKTVGGFFTNAFGFLNAAAVSAPIGVIVAAGSTAADEMQKSKLSMPQVSRLISSSPKGPGTTFSTTASLQQNNNKLGLEAKPHQQPVIKSTKEITPAVEPVVSEQPTITVIDEKGKALTPSLIS